MGGIYDFEELKGRYHKEIASGKAGKVRFSVVISICSISVGANEVLRAIQETIRSEGIQSIILEITGCAGLCHAEPMITVSTPGLPDVTYDLVTPAKAEVITITHGIYSQAVFPWVMKNR